MSEVEKCTDYYQYLKLYRNAFQVHHASMLYKQAAQALGSPPVSSDKPSSRWWMWREVARMLDGTYEQILPESYLWVWIHSDPAFYSFAPVVSKVDRTLVSYIPNAEYGIADRRVMTKIGRFLTANFPGRLLSDRIATVANAYRMQATPPEVRIARKSAEITAIYRIGNGLKSCMAGKAWRQDDNPLATYNNEEGTLPIAVAYIADPGSHEVIARCVLRMDRDPPEFGRIYGNEYAMRQALSRAGYHAAKDALMGCEIVGTASKYDGRKILVPYFDAPSRYALVHVPSGRVFACSGSVDMADKILKKHGLGEMCEGDSLLLETGQYGTLEHDAFLQFKRENRKALVPSVLISCGSCAVRFPKEQVTRCFRGEFACQACLRANYVRAVVNGNGTTTSYVHMLDNDLVSVRCIESYTVRPLNPETVFLVTWSNWMNDYIRSGDAVCSGLLGDFVSKDVCVGFRYLQMNLKGANNKALEFVPLVWLVERYEKSLVAEYHERYPYLLTGVWLDEEDESLLRSLAKQQGVESDGEEAKPETPWGTRLARFIPWACSATRQIPGHDFGTPTDNFGIQQRFFDVTNCALIDIPVVFSYWREQVQSDPRHAVGDETG